jgi:general secretion pathway protein G
MKQHKGFFHKLKKGYIDRMRSVKKQDKQSGTTFVEVLVTMAIIAILMTTITVSIIVFIPRAMVAAAQTNIASMKTAITDYYTQNGKFPDTGTWTEDIASYFENGVPKDPWGKEYKYMNPGPTDNIKYEIRSGGPDGTPGNEDDIVSWKLGEKQTEEKDNK